MVLIKWLQGCIEEGLNVTPTAARISGTPQGHGSSIRTLIRPLYSRGNPIFVLNIMAQLSLVSTVAHMD